MNFAAELLLSCFIAIGVVAVGHAQVGNPSGLEPGTRESAPGVPRSGETNQVDRLFVQQLAMANRAEIEAAKLAAEKGHDATIGKFARQMTNDHTRAENDLGELARARNIQIPNVPDAEQRMMQEGLRQSSGADFDSAYIKGQIKSHQKAATLLEWEIDSGENAQIKSFASQMLPAVFRHLQMAQNIQMQLTGAGPQEMSASPQ